MAGLIGGNVSPVAMASAIRTTSAAPATAASAREARAAELTRPVAISTRGWPARSISRPSTGALSAVASAKAAVTTPAIE